MTSKTLNLLRRSAIAHILLAVLVAGAAWSREFRGTISGKLPDAGGAVVPGATVTVRETHTGSVNRTTSDNAGEYVVPFLLHGDYTITATMSGFETVTRNGISLQSQEHSIVDLKLPVGQADQTVRGAAPLVDQANASVGQVITTQSVEDLPLNGRTPAVLTELSVGVITTSTPGSRTHSTIRQGTRGASGGHQIG